MNIFKLFSVLSALLLLSSPVQAWRSALYPENWQPGVKDSEGRFLHDFSYAGYHQGEQDIPENPPGKTYDVTGAPYHADATGTADATAAIQQAIDDAGTAGGGIVYLPAGTYNVAAKNGEDWALRISQNRVVLRGAGVGKTFICNTDPYMQRKSVVLFQPPAGNWSEPLAGTEIAARSDIAYPGHEIELVHTHGLNPGDTIILRSDCSEAFAAELGMKNMWGPDKLPGMMFCRTITNVDFARNTITVDIPTRFIQKTRDNARIYKIAPLLEECGIESLSVGMIETRREGRGVNDFKTAGTAGYDAHGSHLISFKHARNCWAQKVSSYKPKANRMDLHMLSNGIILSRSSQITVRQCRMEKAFYKGNGGNGYGITLRGNDCLVQDCIASQCRHNFDFKDVGTSGNVLHRCTGQKTKLPSDFHMHFSMANLFDSVTVADGDWLSAVYRKAGTVMHGHCTTESVFWNSRGKGGGKGKPGSNWHWDGKSLVCSSQWGWGYVIGTSGAQFVVTRKTDHDSAPLDFLEGEGEGETLEPQSLYEDQLKRRLNTK